ncbi:hypothetical protein A3D80_00400 [Candidatus Roizmanbacteria bacterium RIFCSPHIGHO2_02_FULL_40_13b]|uniref:General secretion pathway GspH domain-containing protein n=1 Tax=Candidatus Roizmanbacteria bacterium RIFCSPHIGHO2_01_FULL_39_24 TaxID=1802032 RepID=A0A1F7GI49_9BACT|nr:MAG: hypothetical protein A2799_03985 [Candidatus Roizmanbacteria bacterium RIFCSPHIGHO2_01_FULL_39_24]OGK26552.1 MAG: hypothetical protein A3D80_00400 [Candidatus Roizmanbacteria bacterium RIFCSPHIGHO2_02_FULL_40_13b]OGK49402.1 MAG: hypothetical protein A3A56_01895 [Candidatus Roizmanbacteria bacterium RIFCSPLOWO2_01_FULL_40_32]OGK56596.1 MAG: hypothetical protein A3H83_03430 [Candidatus Roizmanbacteria bacterium RIFCSPLOWO2_02_FULL_39_8]
MDHMAKNSGFTFLEILIVVFIITLLSGATATGYTGFNEQKKLDKDTQDMSSTLELAKKKARAGDKSSLAQTGTDYSTCELDGYKVKLLTATTYQLAASMCAPTVGSCPIVSGCSDVSIAPYALSSSVTMSPATGEVFFNNGGLNVSGITSVVFTNSKNNKTKTVSIFTSGAIETN